MDVCVRIAKKVQLDKMNQRWTTLKTHKNYFPLSNKQSYKQLHHNRAILFILLTTRLVTAVLVNKKVYKHFRRHRLLLSAMITSLSAATSSAESSS